MKDKVYIIGGIVLVCIIIASQDTIFEQAGYLYAIVFFGFISILQIYRYNEKKHQISHISFNFKRDNFLWPLFNCYVLGKAVYENNFISINANGYTTSRAVMDVVMFIFVVIQAYICIVHKPILSTEGFLCSDGKFIKFSSITSVVSDNDPVFKHKRLTVGYKPDDSLAFKVKDEDYENIKRHIKFYGLIDVMEGK
ncbi:MAG: hypothetical protein Q4F66_05415 [Clostridium sp.]|nr:hypothetical protein [Clostridium sp.]